MYLKKKFVGMIIIFLLNFQFVFCAKCLQGYHLGDCLEGPSSSANLGSCEYSVDPQRLDKARWDEASSLTIKVISKPCPKCRTSTERDGKIELM